MTFLFIKYKNTSDLFNDLKTSIKSTFFACNFMNIRDSFQFLATRMSSTFNCVSKLKYRNLNSCFHSVILLPCKIGLNPGPTH